MRRRATARILLIGMILSLWGGAFVPFVVAAPAAPAVPDAASGRHCAMPAAPAVENAGTAEFMEAVSCCCSGKPDAPAGSNIALTAEKAACACTMQPASPLPPDPAPFVGVRFAALCATLPPTVRVAPVPLLRRAVSPNLGFLAPPVRSLPHVSDTGRAPPF